MQPNMVAKFLGPPRIVRENEVKGPQVGIVTGLAWTETGGETLSIEVNTMPGKGNLQLTGQLGDIMKESAQAAFSYLGVTPKVSASNPIFKKRLIYTCTSPRGPRLKTVHRLERRCAVPWYQLYPGDRRGAIWP